MAVRVVAKLEFAGVVGALLDRLAGPEAVQIVPVSKLFVG